VKILYFIFFLLGPSLLMAQKISLTGVVINAQGENLPLANALLLPDSLIASSDGDGRFTVHAELGKKEIIISYTGFESLRSKFVMQRDTMITFIIFGQASQLKEVTVNANRYSSEDIVQSTRTGTTTLTQKDINAIPVLGGEADLIKTLQLLPGTIRGVEGSSDLFVRGGAADQNLVLLDGAPIYNTSHLFGFLSVFNPSILDNVEAINGGFPAEFGGRLSSILNIISNADVVDKTKISGDIGLIASRFYLEQPVVKNKASFWIAGRRTYIDQVVKAIHEELPYFFYDINGKVILQPTRRNKIEFSVYNGEDILDIFRDRNDDGNGFLTSYVSGNSSQSLRWAHTFPAKWKSFMSMTRSSYYYNIRNVFEENQLMALSDIEDYSAKIIFRRDSLKNGAAFQFGAEWIRHAISPSIINTSGTIAELLESSASAGKLAQEVAFHLQQEFSVSSRVSVNAGVRLSAGLVKRKNYLVPEPRLSLRVLLTKDQALKLSYSRMAQYMHRISNSAVTTPMDVWYTVTDRIRPQTSHQVAAAWQRFIGDHKIFLSAEAYYKTMKNLIGYEEGTNLFFNTDFESRLIQGTGRAYGLELLARKESGKFTGWLSYTLSWSRRHFAQINGSEWFPSRYDRRHNGALVTQYKIAKRWAVSLVLEYISGARFTPVVGQYAVAAPTLTGLDLIPVFSTINEVKLADTHRLDAGIKFMSKPESKFQWQWFGGVYNVYNRASPVGMIIEQSETDGSLRYLQPGLFGVLPFISYGFKF
jgi:hypothetical protein